MPLLALSGASSSSTARGLPAGTAFISFPSEDEGFFSCAAPSAFPAAADRCCCCGCGVAVSGPCFSAGFGKSCGVSGWAQPSEFRSLLAHPGAVQHRGGAVPAAAVAGGQSHPGEGCRVET